MKIAWLAGNSTLSLNKPYAWFCLGVRGSGKSAFLEHLAELHLSRGNCVLDLFAARSGENLGWLRSEWMKSKRVLLLTAENAIVELPQDLNAEAKPATKISLDDFESYDIIINSSPLYPNLDAEFDAVNNIIDQLWKRVKWSRIIFVVVREAANLLFSRMKIAETQHQAKAFMAYWLRESRHVGCSLALDSQRFMAVDVDIRSLCDFLIFKAQGAGGLPRDLYYIYRYVDPVWMQRMRSGQFVVLSRRGDIGVGVFPLTPWHVKEGEGIVSKLGLKVRFEQIAEQGSYRGTFYTVGDDEHANILSLYSEGMSMVKIAEEVGRSSATVRAQILRHNKAVEKAGYCAVCRRAKGNLEQVLVGR
jgi:hypothetical protein